MPRRRSRNVAVFNFSFVDILATTVGVIIFIMTMVLLNATDRISADGIKEQVPQHQAQSTEQRRIAKRFARLAAKERQTALRYAQPTGTDANAAQQRLESERKGKQRLVNEQRRLGREQAALRAATATATKRVAQLTAQARQHPSHKRQEVMFRIPREHPTTKAPIVFECTGGRVYMLALAGRLHTRNYTAEALGNKRRITRKPNAAGEPTVRAQRPNSQFFAAMKAAPSTTHYVLLLVRPDSFTTFRRLRAALRQRGYHYNWQAMDTREDIIVGGHGGRSTIQ